MYKFLSIFFFYTFLFTNTNIHEKRNLLKERDREGEIEAETDRERKIKGERIWKRNRFIGYKDHSVHNLDSFKKKNYKILKVFLFTFSPADKFNKMEFEPEKRKWKAYWGKRKTELITKFSNRMTDRHWLIVK